MRLSQSVRLVLLAVICSTILLNTGCTLTQPDFAGRLDGAAIGGDGSTTRLQPNAQAEMFRRIKQAKAQNAIVLQVAGDDEPLRVLPLPEEGRSVNVSDLLRQSGAISRFSQLQVRVYRDVEGQIDGVRMDVIMDGKTVRPECDYALRAGDRVMVRRDESTRIGKMLDGIVPSNALRAFGG